MPLTIGTPEFDTSLIYLDGKLILTAIAVDVDEGWVEIPDIQAMAPLSATPETVSFSDSPEPLEEIVTKRLYGKVTLKTFSQ